ncbi:MAG: Hpt domain-containing protein [Chloroflexota bacterium]
MTSEPTFEPEALERLLEITGGDVAFVDELVDTYLDDAVIQLAAMVEAAAAGDPRALVRPAHSLKSSSDNVGAVALANLCRTLESEAREGAVSQAVERVAAVAQAFDAVRADLLAARAAR